MARTTEMGSRTLVWAGLAGKDGGGELHGRYTTSCRVEEESDYILSQEGAEVEDRLWVCLSHRSFHFFNDRRFPTSYTEGDHHGVEEARPQGGKHSEGPFGSCLTYSSWFLLVFLNHRQLAFLAVSIRAMFPNTNQFM